MNHESFKSTCSLSAIVAAGVDEQRMRTRLSVLPLRLCLTRLLRPAAAPVFKLLRVSKS
jgi:hypothetical protein